MRILSIAKTFAGVAKDRDFSDPQDYIAYLFERSEFRKLDDSAIDQISQAMDRADARGQKLNFNYRDFSGKTPLQRLPINTEKSQALFQRIIKSGADVNFTGFTSYGLKSGIPITPLEDAIENYHDHRRRDGGNEGRRALMLLESPNIDLNARLHVKEDKPWQDYHTLAASRYLHGVTGKIEDLMRAQSATPRNGFGFASRVDS